MRIPRLLWIPIDIRYFHSEVKSLNRVTSGDAFKIDHLFIEKSFRLDDPVVPGKLSTGLHPG